MNKRIILLVSISILLITSIAFAESLIYGDDSINNEYVETSVRINESFLYTDTHHILKDGTVFVVGRYLVEAFGGQIEWAEETKTVTIELDDKGIEIGVGSTTGSINGVEVGLYKAPFIKDGRIMIPLRFVSENFGCEVSWIQESYTVDIVKTGLVLPDSYIYDRPYSDEDLELLSKIVTVESGDMSLDVSLAIANTVLNRVKSGQFPNTIREVIYQVDVYKQFPPAHKASFETLQPNNRSIIAAKKALEGINNIQESLFFNNRPFKSKENDLIKVIEGEYFYN